MAKTKTPFLSMGSSGTIGRAITSQKRGTQTLLRTKPTPADPYSLAQAYQRWLYQDYCAEWLALSAPDKQIWRSAGSRVHLTGMSCFLRNRLNTLPDIAGGWRLDFITGNTVLDFGKNLNHGVVYGATLVDGVIDHALSFDGVDDRVVIPNHSSLQIVGDLTLMGFGTCSSWKSLNQLIFKHYSWEYDFGISKSNALAYLIFHHGDGTHETKYSIGFPPALDTWYHIAVVRTASPKELHFYLDGDFLNTVVYAKTPLPSANDVILGRRGASTIWHGIQEHVIILNRALTASDIKRHSLRRYPV